MSRISHDRPFARHNVGREKAQPHPAETGGVAGSAALLPPYEYDRAFALRLSKGRGRSWFDTLSTNGRFGPRRP